MRGKQWSIDAERQLRSFVEEGKSVDDIARIMCKTRLSIKGKLCNLGLKSGVVATGSQRRVAATTATTTENPQHDPATAPEPSTTAPSIHVATGLDLSLPEQLPSPEEALKRMVAAQEALERPNLTKAQESRLDKIIKTMIAYLEVYPKFVHQKELEAEVAELRRQLASEREKTKR